MDIQQQLVSVDSLGTYCGLSVATVCVGNTIKKVFSLDAAWVAFAAAECFCLLGALTKTPFPNGVDFVIALINGCVIFSGAAGMNELLSFIQG